MDKKTATRLENVLVAAAFLWLIWSWWSFSGIYRLVAIAELSIFGAFGAVITFFLSAVITMIFMGFVLKLVNKVTGTVPAPPRRLPPAETKAKMQVVLQRGALLLGSVALIVTLVSGFGLWRFYQNNSSVVTLDLTSPQPIPPGTGIVRLVGFTRPELLVGISTKSTPGNGSNATDYMGSRQKTDNRVR